MEPVHRPIKVKQIHKTANEYEKKNEDLKSAVTDLESLRVRM